MEGILHPLLITTLVLAEVGLWQWRMLVASRGDRCVAVLLGAGGAVLQITAISQVVATVDDPVSVGAYAVGVGGGVLLGLVAGDRLTPGSVAVTVVTATSGVATALWARGWKVTAQAGVGEDGPVAVLSVTIDRRHEARFHDEVARLAPDAAWTAEEVRRRPGAAPSPVVETPVVESAPQPARELTAVA